MEEIKEFRYSNGAYSFSILNLGCAITSLCVPDRSGKIENIMLPFTDPSLILGGNSYLGLTIGRFANRIGRASFDLNGKTYSFAPNDGPNFLHSGSKGIYARFWDVRREDNGFTCHLQVSEKDDGFPGTMDIWVKFFLSSTGVFTIHYKAVCTENCPLNLTNHTYFNLSGNPQSDILRHRITMNSSSIAEINNEKIPTGRVLDVSGTCFDFRNGKEIGRDIEDPMLDSAHGYDHPFLIDRENGALRGFVRFCHVEEPESGRVMNCYTDLPAVHFYTGNWLNGICGYKNRSGFCLETEFCPDFVHHPELPGCILEADSVFESTTAFEFHVLEN